MHDTNYEHWSEKVHDHMIEARRIVSGCMLPGSAEVVLYEIDEIVLDMARINWDTHDFWISSFKDEDPGSEEEYLEAVNEHRARMGQKPLGAVPLEPDEDEEDEEEA